MVLAVLVGAVALAAVDGIEVTEREWDLATPEEIAWAESAATTSDVVR
ncbi:MAG: hypothetical protein M0R73_13510 [Dehalococcoidia bacterium]|nr:hypothetical protein [Dehalococcoidia bacterium]